jgi:hypothetical protein
MRAFGTKSKSTRSIAGILGILLLLFGVLSLVFQSSTSVYAQTPGFEAGEIGPYVNVGPPFRSQTLDSGSDDEDLFVAYEFGEDSVYAGEVNPGPGGRGEVLDDTPANVIPGGKDPAIAVTPGGQLFIVAVVGGEIEEVGCADDDDDCTVPESVSDPEPEIETSCFDGVDNDGDGEADSDDSDCFACFSSGEPTVAGFSGMGARMQFVTAVPDPEQECPFEDGDLCDDSIDNDGDGVADAEDPDCSIEGGFVSLPFGGPNCDDGIDNDGDELTDGEDPGCNEAGEGPCSDGIDNDGDGLTDGDDPGCTIEPPVGIEGEGSSTVNSCRDGLDNDGDEQIDTADPDCQLGEENTGLCSDGIDNDGDGERDSYDEDCFQPVIGLQGSDSDNETADVEPTSSNLQSGTTSPQLTFVQTGPAPPASNADVAASDDGSDVYVVWEEEGDIMFSASHDGGDTWSEKLNLSNNAGVSREPRVATPSDGQSVHVAWQDNTPGNDEIFYSRSTDGGETFNGGSPVGPPINLSNTRRASNDHQLVTEGTNVYLVWVDYTTNNGDIYFRKSNNNGESFSNTNNLSTNNRSFRASRDPDMAAQGSMVAVVWTQYHGSATSIGEIFFRESINNGNSFGSHILVSNTQGRDSKEPQVDYTPEDGERYVAWHDQGGPRRVNTPAGTYNVLAAESDNGSVFSAPFNLSDAPNNRDPGKQTSQLQVVDDVAVWDPTTRRG